MYPAGTDCTVDICSDEMRGTCNVTSLSIDGRLELIDVNQLGDPAVNGQPRPSVRLDHRAGLDDTSDPELGNHWLQATRLAGLQGRDETSDRVGVADGAELAVAQLHCRSEQNGILSVTLQLPRQLLHFGAAEGPYEDRNVILRQGRHRSPIGLLPSPTDSRPCRRDREEVRPGREPVVPIRTETVIGRCPSRLHRVRNPSISACCGSPLHHERLVANLAGTPTPFPAAAPREGIQGRPERTSSPFS